MTTFRPTVHHLFSLALMLCAPIAEVAAAGLPRIHGDPPAVVAQALLDAQAAVAAGDAVAAIGHVDRGLGIAEAAGRVRYQQARLETWAIDWREREVLRLLAAGDTAAARSALQELSAPLRSDYAQRRRAELERRIEATESSQAEARPSDQRWRERRMAAAAKWLERADRELDRSRSNSRRTVAAARHAEVALRRYRAAERELVRLEEGGSAEAAAELRLRATAGGIAAMLQLADAKTNQGNFRSALDWLDEVQLREPGNARAAELRQTVQFAAAAATAWLGWPAVGGVVR